MRFPAFSMCLVLIVALLGKQSVFSQDSSLVLHLRCDGSANDASLYGNNGTVMGAVPTADRFGREGRAYWFDGDGAKIVIHNAPSLNPSSALTITFWANVDSMTNNYLDVLCKGGAVVGYFANREYSVYLKQNLEAAYFQLISAGDGQGQHESFSYSFYPHTWQFFVGVIDRNTHLMHVYLNGEEQTLYNAPDSYSSFNVNEYDLWIGASPEGIIEHNSYRGTLDDLRLYRRALAAEEIRALYEERGDTLPHVRLTSLRSFGHVALGHEAGQTLVVRNVGSSPLTVSSLSTTSPVFIVSASALELAPFDSSRVQIVYRPGTAQADSGSLIILSDDPDSPEMHLSLSGVGFSPGRAPVILSVSDIPADQGHQVRVSWFRSFFDTTVDTLHAEFYDVWRQLEGSPEVWDFIGSVPAVRLDEYGFIAPTIFDSSRSGGLHWSVFRVSTRFLDQSEPAFSAPDSGYSIDNLVPSQVAGLCATVSGQLPTLTWDKCDDPDIDHYEIYASPQPSASLQGMSPLAQVESPMFIDHSYVAGSARYYRVVAVDRDGNMGSPSAMVAVTTTDVEWSGSIPTKYVLGQNYPNPFNPTTTVRFGVPKRSHVFLAVYNTLGQRVAVLVNGEQAPGYHDVWFSGSGLASGIYFCRLHAGGTVRTISLLLLK
jgi:hypothetical protein